MSSNEWIELKFCTYIQLMIFYWPHKKNVLNRKKNVCSYTHYKLLALFQALRKLKRILA